MNEQLANCGGIMGGWGQQVSFGPPPSPEAQLQQRAAELTAFLAIDHESKRVRAREELARVNAALACLKPSAG